MLENHHTATLFKILSFETNNVLEKLDHATLVKIRKMVISNILATDMKFHFDLLEKVEKFQKID